MTDKAELIQKRGRVKGILTRMKTFAEGISQNTPLEDISMRLDKVDEVWDEFQSIEDSLLTIDNQTVSEMEEYEEKYFDIKSLFTRAINSRTPRPSNDNNVASDHLNSTMNQFFAQQQSFFQSLDRSHSQAGASTTRLPKLNIPIFSGDYKEWISFQDLFEATIHTNSSLTGSQKLQYLKGLLRGNAANVIRHLTVSDTNYTEAWERLKARFNKKFHITTSLIKTFLDVNVINQPAVKSLRNLCDTFDEVLRGLKALGNEAQKRDPWLIHIGLLKIDSESRELWSQEISDREFPSFEDFLNFLSKRCDALEASGAIAKRQSSCVKSLHAAPIERKEVICQKCHINHPLYKCEQFKSELPKTRRDFVVNKSLCFKCLGAGHSVRDCRSKIRCNQCKGNHHPLLHSSPSQSRVAGHGKEANESTQPHSLETVPGETSTARPIASVNATIPQCKSSTCNTHVKSPNRSKNQVPSEEHSKEVSILPTVVANVIDNLGRPQQCRMLLDSGSQVSLISEACVQRLNLIRENARLAITGLQSSCVGTTKGKTSLNILSRCNKTNLRVQAFIINQLTGLIPARTFSIADWKQIEGIDLADPAFNKASPIDIIIGADHFFEILRSMKKFDQYGKLIAQETIFGWVVFGCSASINSQATNFHTTLVDLDKSLRRFWETEELQYYISPLTQEEEQCERHFRTYVSRNKEGRYSVSLPFKEETIPLGDSMHSATKRVYAIERKFMKNDAFKIQYSKFMDDYENLGHMELIPNEEREIDSKSCFYLPHHAVFKNAPESKIRVVFDGSCKSSSGISLNEKLLVGPVVQRDLVTILMNFRKHLIAFSADIEKMYRQIEITSKDRDFQRILWRENPSQPLRHYRLKTVTYGTSCAPFLATRVLQKIADDSKDRFSMASAVIRNDFYVDDLLSGSQCLSEAVKLKAELTHILHSSGFNLTKWCSNSSDLLVEDQNLRKPIQISDRDDMVKVLGIQWNPSEDTFSFSLSTLASGGVSKRIILSESSKIFDPLGWLAPLVISIKMLLQQLWLLKCDWDDQLPDELVRKWESFKEQLPEVMKIKIPRRVYFSSNEVQFHGFSDASEVAYGAVIYCRSLNNSGKIITRIVSSKTRVAPLKQVSLPRLELCGALLLARLMKKVKEAMNLERVEIHAWTDSTIVLTWLSDLPRRWKTYVGNRTAEILDLIPRSQWGHVQSQSNPADLVTRGVSAVDLPNLSFWWNGPEWLSQPSSAWPTDPALDNNEAAHKEQRKSNIVCGVQKVNEGNLLPNLVKRFSSFNKLNRVMAHCFRFAWNSKVSKAERRSTTITARELHEAAKFCFKCIQQVTFSEEIEDLKDSRQVSSRSPIKGLTPFLDEFEILRVGGRLENSSCNFNAKHPIILPKSHPLSEILLRDLHKIHLHPGTSLLVGISRQRYWILGVREIAKKVTQTCVVYFRQRVAKTTQLMGNLPKERVTISRAFYNVGIDYAGPVAVCTKSGRGVKPCKAYISLFVCLVTKALHLELVSSLSADAFVAALRRFISRRGIPAKIISDNGTNFVGGKRHINELHNLALSSLTNETISIFLAQHKIEWSFIPPGAPHFGGIWEAGVKSVKWHLRRVIGETILTFEELSTLLAQIEAVLNSRPYGYLNSSPDDLDVLTPSHFLIGEPSTTLPEPDYTEAKITRLGRWQHLQAMLQGFWKRWRIEYLSALQERPKWRRETDSLEVGELVIIHEDNIPPSKWLMGRVVTTHPGNDGLVRVVSLRTKRGTIRRAINKVFKLPTS